MTELKAFLSSIPQINVEVWAHNPECPPVYVEYSHLGSKIGFWLQVDFDRVVDWGPFAGFGESYIKSKNITLIDSIILNGDKIKFNEKEALSLFNDILLNKIYVV